MNLSRNGSILPLLRTRRFMPLFLTQFFGAFNDNLYKNVLVILITYRLAAEGEAQYLVTLAAGIFILPFFLFSATAGQLADKWEKSRLIRRIKMAEIILMALGTAALYSGNVAFLLAVLFAMGAQSAFFGPVKYSILPELLKHKELIAGNALVEGGTFLAILLGTLMGGIFGSLEHAELFASAGILALAAAGYWVSRGIPACPPAAPNLHVGWNLITDTWRILKYAAERRDVFLCVLGISWFWLIGATFLAQFPTFAKDILGAGPSVVTLFLTVFSVGIGVGSLLCNRLLRGQIHAGFVPIAAVAITLFTIDLYSTSQTFLGLQTGGELSGIGTFLARASAWHVLLDLFGIAVAGGVYIVPLYAIMQERSHPAHRARVVAGNNVLNALFMVISAAGTLVMFKLSFTVTDVFLAIAILNAAAAVVICRLLPLAFTKSLIRLLLRLCYRVEVRGEENLRNAGEKVVIVANHASLLDAGLLAAFLPVIPLFAVNTHMARRWWFKPFLALVKAFPMDPTNPLATKALIEEVRKGQPCLIFPEGRITVTGALMKIYEGPGLIADKAGAALVPVRIDGAQYTPFSYLRGKVRRRWLPRITLTILPRAEIAVDEAIKGRARRQKIGQRLYDIMSLMLFETSERHLPLFAALLQARGIHGRNTRIAEDMRRVPLTYTELIRASLVLGRKIARRTQDLEPVGLLLPTSLGAVVTFFALHAFGRVPAMLNFSAGTHSVRSACATAQLRLVITSREFISLAQLEGLVDALRQSGISVLYLEDLQASLRLWDKLWAWASSFGGERAYRRRIGIRRKGLAQASQQAAVILFTSGSEGAPKGVVLSHANLQANRFQLAARIDFGPQDIVFNALPVFHSFGLLAGTLLPLLSGIRTFLYPSPLHYRVVPELVYDTNATVMFGTDTFLAGYARYANPYDFYSLRYIFAGAEKLREETRRAYVEKFGIRIFEGYGATETAPTLSTNTPMHYRTGTVGRLLPGIEYMLEPVEGVPGGRLLVRGPNIMMGYILAEKPGILLPPVAGWYDTGDIVQMDEDGYLSITGRAKRFAKVGGEMVSLAAVEALAQSCWPDHKHAALARPDERKGEQVVLISTHPAATREKLQEVAREKGVPEIQLPRTVLLKEDLPLLGTGKVDYPALKKWLEDQGC